MIPHLFRVCRHLNYYFHLGQGESGRSKQRKVHVNKIAHKLWFLPMSSFESQSFMFPFRCMLKCIVKFWSDLNYFFILKMPRTSGIQNFWPKHILSYFSLLLGVCFFVKFFVAENSFHGSEFFKVTVRILSTLIKYSQWRDHKRKDQKIKLLFPSI